MKPTEIYMENIFKSIAKVLAKYSTEKALKDALKDPNLASDLKSLKLKYDQIKDKLPELCKKYPHLKACEKFNQIKNMDSNE